MSGLQQISCHVKPKHSEIYEEINSNMFLHRDLVETSYSVQTLPRGISSPRHIRSRFGKILFVNSSKPTGTWSYCDTIVNESIFSVAEDNSLTGSRKSRLCWIHIGFKKLKVADWLRVGSLGCIEGCTAKWGIRGLLVAMMWSYLHKWKICLKSLMLSSFYQSFHHFKVRQVSV